MIKKYTYCFIIWLMLLSINGLAQQQSLYSQYMFNGLAINPAYAGSHEALSLTALGRKQWLNTDGAPTTLSFAAHAPVNHEKIALGIHMLSDQIGVTNQWSVNAAFAYRLQLDKTTTFSMGLQGGVTQYQSNFGDLVSRNPNDPAFSLDYDTRLVPNFGVGAYYYTDKYFIGLSVPYLINWFPELNKTTFSSSQIRHYFLNAGYVFTLSDDVKLKPSGLVKWVHGAAMQFDVNMNLLLREVVWIGASYRTSGTWVFLTKLQLSNQLSMGYALDVGSGQLRAGASHEVMLNYRFYFKNTAVKTPRYF